MSTKNFSICSNCMHRFDCVLTSQKDKVWSCSEFDENQIASENIEFKNQPVLELEFV